MSNRATPRKTTAGRRPPAEPEPATIAAATHLPDLHLTVDPVDDLTIPELRDGNAQLGADLVRAITEATAERWDALAIVGWLHERRTNPKANLARWTGEAGGLVRPPDLMRALTVSSSFTAPLDDEADDDDSSTPGERADALEAAAKGDPTGPTP